MAYFECVIGNGGSSTDIPLIVTCDSDFAGTTITCTDGTTTLTDTCPSSSPYTITFSLPNAGSWTVSGTISGTPISESIVIQASELDLHTYVNLTVDFYSAANDTVSYTGVDGQTHTITTDSSGHATATITISPSGNTFTFTSLVAKDTDNVANAYSKSIVIDSNTTSIKVMPDTTYYWYGYLDSFAGQFDSGGYHQSSGTDSNEGNRQAPTVTQNTNYFQCTQGNGSYIATTGIVYFTQKQTIAANKKVCAYVKYARIYHAKNRYQHISFAGFENIQEQYNTTFWETIVTLSGQADVSVSDVIKKTTLAQDINTYVGFIERSIGDLQIYAVWIE